MRFDVIRVPPGETIAWDSLRVGGTACQDSPPGFVILKTSEDSGLVTFGTLPQTVAADLALRGIEVEYAQ